MFIALLVRFLVKVVGQVNKEITEPLKPPYSQQTEYYRV